MRPPQIKELKPSEFIILHNIEMAKSDKKQDSLMISKISERIGIASPTVTQLVNSLKRKGYVVKKSDPSDGRIVRVALSKKGEKYVKKASEAFYSEFCELAKHLGEEKSTQLAQLMNEVFTFFSDENKVR